FHILVSGSQSTDGGASWGPGPVIDNITFDPSDRDTVYGSTFGSAAKALVKSTDNGASFVPLNVPPFGFLFGILCDPNHPGTVYVSGLRNIGAAQGGDSGILKSADG